MGSGKDEAEKYAEQWAKANPDKKEKFRFKAGAWTGIGALVLLVFVSGLVASYKGTLITTTEVTKNTNPNDYSWVPALFSIYDQNVAYEFIDDPECSYSRGLCVGIVVISKDGCPNVLSGKMPYKDKNDVIIGYARDSLSSLPPKTKGELIFDILKWERFSGIGMPEITCY